jgi:tetratricopeptide (TPR) repeat protein
MINQNAVESKTEKDPSSALTTFRIVIGTGIVVILLYAIHNGINLKLFEIAGTGIIVAGGSLLCGGLLGFLFGIPRTRQKANAGGNGNAESAADNRGAGEVEYQPNTNLEEISDWLTKILVGVGLTQLKPIGSQLQKFAEKAGEGLGSSSIFALGLIVFFLVSGFFYGYLWARLYLRGLMESVDSALLKKLSNHLKKQPQIDAEALYLAQQQLDPSPNEPPISVGKLEEALIKASLSVQYQVFLQAHTVRSENWKDNKSKMERTIPIFKALIKTDKEQKNHRYYAQLGYALKDSVPPDWEEAEKLLTKAIRIRGDWRREGWLYYEFNRAICRIELDGAYIDKKPSALEVVKEITADLYAAVNSELVGLIEAGQVKAISEWMKLNSLTIGKLKANQ